MKQDFLTDEHYITKQTNGALMSMFCKFVQKRRLEIVGEKRKTSYIQKRVGAHPFIPLRADTRFMGALIYIKKYLDSNRRYGIRKFLDAGCGIGNIMVLAKEIGFDVHGLEIDPKTIAKAKEVFPHIHGHIEKYNILTYKDYGKYDVIYYYQPLRDKDREVRFELRVENQMKVGAIVFPIGKDSFEISLDKRFKRHNMDVKAVSPTGKVCLGTFYEKVGE